MSPASPAPRLLRNGLVNHAPIRCAVCGQYVATFAGIPVMMDDRARIIYFAHPACCTDAT